jgi:hypothetical protein
MHASTLGHPADDYPEFSELFWRRLIALQAIPSPSVGLLPCPRRLVIPDSPSSQYAQVINRNVECRPTGVPGEPVWLPITATPTHDVEIGDAIAQALRRLFPRDTVIRWVKPENAVATIATTFRAEADYRATNHDFLAKALHDDPDDDDVLMRAEPFLASEAVS